MSEMFEHYLSTCFGSKRDKSVSYKFYENDYGPFLPRDINALVLDIGCGTGEFLAYMKSRGYLNVFGIDASPEMAEFCKKAGLDNVSAVGDAAGYLADNAKRFDLITLNDVIEHFQKKDTIVILKAVRSALKQGGVLIVRTGNFSTPGGAYLRYKDFTHDIGYTEFSLEQVMRMAGFSEIEVKGNRYYMSCNPQSLFRNLLIRIWFFILKGIYTIELGCDRPRVYSKLLIAICKNV